MTKIEATFPKKDAQGREIKRLIQNKNQMRGNYKVHFTPCQMQAGTYLCVLRVGNLEKGFRFVKTN